MELMYLLDLRRAINVNELACLPLAIRISVEH
jgi:hypothetical protein